MKKTICIIGAITLILLNWGILFKIMHYPGGGVMLLLSMGLLMPTLIILTAIHINKRK